jgi:hypothetical protein
MGNIAKAIIDIIGALNGVEPGALLFLSALCQLASVGFATICVLIMHPNSKK